MSNRLKMSKVKSILTLREQGWSYVRIAKELGIHRVTVARLVRLHLKPTQAPTGSDHSKPTQTPINVSNESVGRSDCDPHREVIQRKLDQGLHAKRLLDEGFQLPCGTTGNWKPSSNSRRNN